MIYDAISWIFMWLLTPACLIGALAWPKVRVFFQKKGQRKDERRGRDQRELKDISWIEWATVGAVLFVTGFFTLFVGSSIVFIGDTETGHLDRKIWGDDLPKGRMIALGHQRGRQAKILRPGLQLHPWVRLFYDVDPKPMLEVPEGKVAVMFARDGIRLPKGQTYAPMFDEGEEEKMFFDAEYFLQEGKGHEGPQTSVLKPGTHPINLYLWDYKIMPVTEVKQGEIGVVRSNVHTRVDFPNLSAEKPDDIAPKVHTVQVGGTTLSVPVVKVGAPGIWEKGLLPNKYYLNPNAFTVYNMPARMSVAVFKGGYTKKWIDLTLNTDGSIEQTPGSVDVPKPDDAAGEAIHCKMEGWEVDQELRIEFQVESKWAPIVWGALGEFPEIVEKVIIPITRSQTRNVAGGGRITVLEEVEELDKDDKPITVEREVTRRVKVLDTQDNRELLEQLTLDKIKPAASRAGVTVLAVRFGQTNIPPELLVARKRQQIATRMTKTYEDERVSQMKRIEMEKAREEAANQSIIVQAQLKKKASDDRKLELKNDGEGERDKLLAIAEGQKAQVDVLGEERTMVLRVTQLILEAVERNPEAFKAIFSEADKLVPHTVISTGKDTGLSGPLAILGQLMSPSRNTKGKGDDDKQNK